MPKRPITDLHDLWRSEAQNHWRVQGEIAKQSQQNALVAFLTTKVWGWIKHYFKSRFMGKVAYRAYPFAGDTGIYPLLSHSGSDEIVVNLASDWASNTQEADNIAQLMENDHADYTLHLGDVYYVGTPQEIDENFGTKGSWPRGKVGTLAIPGNHEFYSNGKGFYENLLPKMKLIKQVEPDVITQQKAGFFCLENDFWRIVALDTGYNSVGAPLLELIFHPDASLRDEQINWLRDFVRITENDTRGLVLLTHHQYFSAFESNYETPAKQLAQLLPPNGKEVIWFWGHEHRLAIYDLHRLDEGIYTHGRCIGHGGMPVEVPTAQHPLDEAKATKQQLRFYDRQYRIVKDGNKDVFLGNNGYARLTFNQATLKVEHIQCWQETPQDEPIAVLVLTEHWTVNLANGDLHLRYEHPPTGAILTER